MGDQVRPGREVISWQVAYEAAERLWRRWPVLHKEGATIYGVPTGGCVVAMLIGQFCRVEGVPAPGILENGWEKDDDRPFPDLVVDDIVDSGRTLRRYDELGVYVDALFRKDTLAGAKLAPDADFCSFEWVVLPWDHTTDEGPETNIVRVLEWLGEDPSREGLVETPGRVCRSLDELTAGRKEDPAAILSKRFHEANDQMVVLRDIRFTSVCEHHLLPFTGTAAVGYIPAKRKNTLYEVVGVSKLARLVACFARRLQNQERLANQIVQTLMTELNPIGAGVILKASHGCMACRGANQPSAQMITSALRGAMLEDPRARSEFLSLATERM